MIVRVRSPAAPSSVVVPSIPARAAARPSFSPPAPRPGIVAVFHEDEDENSDDAAENGEKDPDHRTDGLFLAQEVAHGSPKEQPKERADALEND